MRSHRRARKLWQLYVDVQQHHPPFLACFCYKFLSFFFFFSAHIANPTLSLHFCLSLSSSSSSSSPSDREVHKGDCISAVSKRGLTLAHGITPLLWGTMLCIWIRGLSWCSLIEKEQIITMGREWHEMLFDKRIMNDLFWQLIVCVCTVIDFACVIFSMLLLVFINIYVLFFKHEISIFGYFVRLRFIILIFISYTACNINYLQYI